MVRAGVICDATPRNNRQGRATLVHRMAFQTLTQMVASSSCLHLVLNWIPLRLSCHFLRHLYWPLESLPKETMVRLFTGQVSKYCTVAVPLGSDPWFKNEWILQLSLSSCQEIRLNRFGVWERGGRSGSSKLNSDSFIT